MVTFAQAQERAEEWINGDVPSYQHREVRAREFGPGFVVWAEDRADGPRAGGATQRLVIARDSGEATAPPARVDLNQTSFLLSPPEWLQEAADRMGIPDRREDAAAGAAAGAGDGGTGDGTGGGSGGGAGSAPAVPAPTRATEVPAAG